MVNIPKLFNYSPENIAPELLKATDGYVLVPEDSFMPTKEISKKVLDFVEEPAPDIFSFPFLTSFSLPSSPHSSSGYVQSSADASP